MRPDCAGCVRIGSCEYISRTWSLSLQSVTLVRMYMASLAACAWSIVAPSEPSPRRHESSAILPTSVIAHAGGTPQEARDGHTAEDRQCPCEGEFTRHNRVADTMGGALADGMLAAARARPKRKQRSPCVCGPGLLNAGSVRPSRTRDWPGATRRRGREGTRDSTLHSRRRDQHCRAAITSARTQSRATQTLTRTYTLRVVEWSSGKLDRRYPRARVGFRSNHSKADTRHVPRGLLPPPSSLTPAPGSHLHGVQQDVFRGSVPKSMSTLESNSCAENLRDERDRRVLPSADTTRTEDAPWAPAPRHPSRLCRRSMSYRARSALGAAGPCTWSARLLRRVRC